MECYVAIKNDEVDRFICGKLFILYAAGEQ